MWIRVALDQSSVHYNEPVSLSYIDGKNIEEYYFDNETAQALETDGFLTAMWAKLDAVFDWGDCDFSPQKSVLNSNSGCLNVSAEIQILSFGQFMRQCWILQIKH